MCTGTKIQQVRVFVSDDIINIIAVDKETFARNNVYTFLRTCLLIHLFSLFWAWTFCFLPSVGSPSNLLLGRDEWLGRYCITLPVPCVRVCVCVRFWLAPPKHVWCCLQSNRKDVVPVSTMFSNPRLFSVCHLLFLHIIAASLRTTLSQRIISCFLGCCVFLFLLGVGGVGVLLLLWRLRIDWIIEYSSVAFPCWCCALYCQFLSWCKWPFSFSNAFCQAANRFVCFSLLFPFCSILYLPLSFSLCPVWPCS